MESNQEIQPWEFWIVKNEPGDEVKTSYDLLCELAISSYDLNERRRQAELKDMVHYFILWWNENKGRTKKYKTLQAIGESLGMGHSNVLHYIRRRKPTINFDKNVECLKDFLNS